MNELGLTKVVQAILPLLEKGPQNSTQSFFFYKNLFSEAFPSSGDPQIIETDGGFRIFAPKSNREVSFTKGTKCWGIEGLKEKNPGTKLFQSLLFWVLEDVPEEELEESKQFWEDLATQDSLPNIVEKILSAFKSPSFFDAIEKIREYLQDYSVSVGAPGFIKIDPTVEDQFLGFKIETDKKSVLFKSLNKETKISTFSKWDIRVTKGKFSGFSVEPWENTREKLKEHLYWLMEIPSPSPLPLKDFDKCLSELER